MARNEVYADDFEGFAAPESINSFYSAQELAELFDHGAVSEFPISGDATAARREWK